MQQQFIDLISNFNKVSMDTTKELMVINSRAFEKFSQKQIELINNYASVSTKQLEAASEIKGLDDVSEYANTQMVEMQKCAETFTASAKDTMEIVVEMTTEINTLMQKGMDAAAAELKAVPSKKKAA